MNQTIKRRVIQFFTLVTVAGLMLSAACEQQPSKEELKKEVMDIHDYAMAKMGTLHDLEMKINAAVDSTNEKQMKLAASAINALVKADEDMMDWMRQYKEPDDVMKYEEMVKYFAVQKEMIQKVKEDTDKSIADANKLLESMK
ncbi:MAG: hypothetical protein ACPGJS_23275 [Flammeovirgaceae bacterium]